MPSKTMTYQDTPRHPSPDPGRNSAIAEPDEDDRPRLSLRRPRVDEFAEIASWSEDDCAASPFTNTGREALDADGISAALASGLNMRVFVNRKDEAVGMATWGTRGNPRSFDIGMLIADPSLWKVGIGGQAAILVTDYLFMTEDAHRVSMTTASFNPHTSPALARGGFTLDGVLRDYFYLDGEYHDALIWSMLRSEHSALIAKSSGTPLQYRPTISDHDKTKARVTIRRILADPRIPNSWRAVGSDTKGR